jgi:ABC-2 type transport system permease protein
MIYLRLWRRYVLIALMRLAEYRFNFGLSVLQGIGQLGVTLAVYLAFYRFADNVAGWTADQALVLVGFFWVFDGFWTALFTTNLRRVSTLIQEGELDFVLLRPASTQFLVSLSAVNVAELVKLVTGSIVIVIAGQRAGVEWSPTGVLTALTFMVCGLAALYAVRFMLVTCTFWALKIGEMYDVLSTFYDVARFPVTVFDRPVRDVLTYVVPVAFAATFPAQALLGNADLRLLPAGVLLAAAGLFASNRFWRFGLRFYTSASS